MMIALCNCYRNVNKRNGGWYYQLNFEKTNFCKLNLIISLLQAERSFPDNLQIYLKHNPFLLPIESTVQLNE